MIPLFSIGPFTVYFFGLMIAIGAIIGGTIFIREARRQGLDTDILTNGVMYSLIAGIIGARIIYVFVYNPSYYLSNPIEIFAIHEGGLSIHGGILGGLLVGYLFLRKHKIPVWKTLDIVAPALILAQGISRIGCDVFGGPISDALPWGVQVNEEYLHPAQAYEFILDYLLFGYLWLLLKKRKYTGQVFLHYLVGFMLIRGTVEFVRINPIIFGPFSVSHLMSLIGIIIAFIFMIYRKQKGNMEKSNFIKTSDYVKTALFVFVLMILSLILYFLVQG